MIGLPPSFGAVKLTVICAFPNAAVGGAGVEGIVLGTAAADAADGVPSPFAFVAVTVHVYDLPLESDPTVSGDVAPLALPAVPPFDDVQLAVYFVIALPPSFGAVNVTVICALPDVTPGAAGAAGTVLGVVAAEAGDAAPAPFAFVAATVHVYDLPFVRPPTTVGDAASEADPAAPQFDDVQVAV